MGPASKQVRGPGFQRKAEFFMRNAMEESSLVVTWEVQVGLPELVRGTPILLKECLA
jgi:hypothetical protein